MASTEPENVLQVVAGVVRNEHGEILLTQRMPGRHQEGKWEFPGGKREVGEDAFTALARELKEELGITVHRVRPRICIPYEYPDVAVVLDVYDVESYSGEAKGLEGQSITWVSETELDQYDYPAANLPVISSLRLPTCYAISCATRLGENRFVELLEQRLVDGLQLLQLREPGLPVERFEQLARRCTELVHRYHARILLNTDRADLVAKVGADGIHLSSRALMRQPERPMQASYLVAASCHNVEEIRKAQEIDATFIVLSAVKATASHPDVVPIGWDRFGGLARDCALPVYALGGMTKEDIEESCVRGGQGVAMLGAAWAG